MATTEVDRSKMRIGDTIKIKSNALNISANLNSKFASFVYTLFYKVMQIGLGANPSADYIAFGDGTNYTGAVKLADIQSITYSTPTTTAPKSATVVASSTKATNGTYTEIGQLLNKLSDAESGSVATTSSNNFVSHENGSKYKSTVKPDDYSTVTIHSNSDMNLSRFGTSDPSIIPADVTTMVDANGRVLSSHVNDAITHAPSVVQNNAQFPKVQSFNVSTGEYEYDYNISYDLEGKSIIPGSVKSLNDQYLEVIRNKHNLWQSSRLKCFNQDFNNYNRFKLPNPNSALSKSFGHVFFTRPDLNILKRASSGFELSQQVKNNPEIYRAYKQNPGILKALVRDNGQAHDFMLTLSNAAATFGISDETVKTATYGDTWSGYKIPYGKHNYEGKVAGSFDIEYTDDRNLNIFHIHKIWTDYISNIYKGKWISKGDTYNVSSGQWETDALYSYIENKILDYACAIYYIMTAEDGETIIFWSKYYGVFPTNTSSNTFSWSRGDNLSSPKLRMTYQYAFKKDYDPFTLVEFNMLSDALGSGYTYVNKYDKVTLGGGVSMVGAPFIETQIDPNKGDDESYQYKLRFRPAEEL